MKHILQWLAKWCWRLLATGLSLLVVLLLLFRLTFSCLPWFQKYITGVLSDQMNTDLKFEQVQADWQQGLPMLSLRGMTLQGKDANTPGFSVNRLDLELNLRESLLRRTVIFSSLVIDGVSINLVEGDGARWHLLGIEDIAGSSTGGYNRKKKLSLLEWINYQSLLDIRDINLNLKKTEGESRLVSKYFMLADFQGQKTIAGRLESEQGFLELRGKGYGTTPDNSQWSARISAKKLDLQNLCILWSGCYSRLGSTVVEADTRIEYRDGLWQLSGELGLPYFAYRDNGGRWQTLSGRTDIFMEARLGHSWQMWLDEFNVHNGSRGSEALYWKNNWYLSGDMSSQYSFTIASSSLDLNKLTRWGVNSDFIPENCSELLSTLNPKGQVDDLAVKIYPGHKPFDFDLSASLKQVSVDAWGGGPVVQNISGQVRMGLLDGYLELDTEQLVLGFPELFRENWVFDTAKARLYWDTVDGVYILKSDDIAVTAPDGNLKGKLRLDIPFDDRPMDMALTVGMAEGNASATSKFLPVYLPMDEDVVEWLDHGIIGATINEGGFIYNGAIVGGQRFEDSRWGLFFDVADGQIDYGLGEWPEVHDLSARIFVNDDRVEVLGQSAKSAGANLENFVARVPMDEPVLHLHSRVVADGETVHHFLTETPVDDYLKGQARRWKLGGDVSGKIKLELPFSDMEAFKFELDTRMNKALFAMPEADIEIDHLHGRLTFSTGKGLNSHYLFGSFLGRPSEFQIQTVMNGSALMYTDIGWNSRATVPRLQQWLNLDWLSFLEGETAYEARLRIAPGAMDLSVSSELTGLEIELPAPLAKQPHEQLPLELKLISNVSTGDNFELSAVLGEIGHVSLLLSPDFSMESASMAFGKNSPLLERQDDKVRISGFMPELNLEPWLDRFGGQPGRSDEVQVARQLQIEDLVIGHVRYADYDFKDLEISLSSWLGETILTVDSEKLAGSLWIPTAEKKPYRLVLDRLYLPESEESADNTDAKVDVLAEVNPLLLPDIEMEIKSLRVGEKDLGSISFDLGNTENGVKIDNLRSQLAGLKLTGFADWVYIAGEHHSWFQGRLEGGSIGELNKALGFPELVEAQKSQMDISLNWQGSPLAEDFSTIKGMLDIKLEKGRIIDNGAGSGALKLFGVLNVDTLRRRMFLDFSDLYSSGISFDKMTGVVHFDNGIITFDQPMVIDGPTSKIELNGLVDANKETLDLNMSVTLPVTSNLPILSVLLGTAPPLAGVFFIADKLVGDQVNKLASIHYKITGTFDEPEMKLDEEFARRARNAVRGN